MIYFPPSINPETTFCALCPSKSSSSEKSPISSDSSLKLPLPSTLKENLSLPLGLRFSCSLSDGGYLFTYIVCTTGPRGRVPIPTAHTDASTLLSSSSLKPRTLNLCLQIISPFISTPNPLPFISL